MNLSSCLVVHSNLLSNIHHEVKEESRNKFHFSGNLARTQKLMLKLAILILGEDHRNFNKHQEYSGFQSHLGEKQVLQQ